MRHLNSTRVKFAAGELCKLKVTFIHRVKAGVTVNTRSENMHYSLILLNLPLFLLTG